MTWESEKRWPGGKVIYEPRPDCDKYLEIYVTQKGDEFIRRVVTHFERAHSRGPLGPERLGQYVKQLVEQGVPAAEIGRVVTANYTAVLATAMAIIAEWEGTCYEEEWKQLFTEDEFNRLLLEINRLFEGKAE